LIVEGALNAARLASAGFHAVAITGVHNYRMGNKGTPIIPELIHFAKSRQAERLTIVFDSDTADPEDKRELWNGIHNLSQDLMKLRSDRRDTIFICRPPPKLNGDKNGPDDYLHSAGIDAFTKLIREQSERYADNPYLVVERDALARFIFEDMTGNYYDTTRRQSVKTDHTNSILATYGFVDDITSPRPTRIQYSTKRLLSAPGLRIAHGKRYQPDRDDIFFPDENFSPPLFYINTFQPEDVPQSIKGDVSIVYRVMNSICRDTPEAVQKMLQIIAKHAQFPALAPKYALLMTGQQGSGKSNLAKLIGLSLSKRFHSGRVDLRIGFNAEWRGFACKEWAEFDKDMDEEWLKDLITGETYNVSTKHVAGYVDSNHTLNIFTCNGLQAKIQRGDRRFLVCGTAKSDDKALGLEFESWIKGTGPNHFRYHLLNDIDCSNYDNIDVNTELKDAVIEASQSYRSTVYDYIMEEIDEIPGLECLPNPILEGMLDKYKVGLISFRKEFAHKIVASKVVKINGTAYRFSAFVNQDKWKKCDDNAQYKKQFEIAQKLLKTNKF
jgi:hypothetical protein